VGYSDSFDPNGDIYVIKIAPDMGVTEGTEGRYPKSVYLFEIQPNPIHDKVIVRYALSKKTRIKLSLFDIAGRIVTTLSDKDQNPGAHRENYEITNLPQGVYFITIDVEGNRETRKMGGRCSNVQKYTIFTLSGNGILLVFYSHRLTYGKKIIY
jgi:hypothetical protein